MNRKRLIAAIVVAFLLGLLLVLRKHTGSHVVSEPPSETSKSDATNRVARGMGSKETSTVYLTNLPPEMRAKIKEQDQQRQAMRQSEVAAAFLNQKNGRIDFWGLVVDQDDKPMQGVEILMDTRIWNLGLGFNAKFPEYHRTTDANGYFELLNATGDSLGIKAVRKAGYVLSPEDKQRAISFPYHGMSVKFTPDPRNPVVIRLWKAKGAAALVYYQTGGPSLLVDGTPVYYDLITGKKVEQGGHLEVRLVREEVSAVRDPKDVWSNKRNAFSWRTEISVPGGGLQWREDPFGYEAPADGYVPTLAMGQEANDPEWKSRIQGQFYFRTAEGYYGRIEFKQNTDGQPPPCPFYVTCYLNPSGSRNLEYDSSLRIDPRRLIASSSNQTTPQPPPPPPKFVPPVQSKPIAPVIPQPPPGFQAFTNRGKAFPLPVQPRPQ